MSNTFDSFQITSMPFKTMQVTKLKCALCTFRIQQMSTKYDMTKTESDFQQDDHRSLAHTQMQTERTHDKYSANISRNTAHSNQPHTSLPVSVLVWLWVVACVCVESVGVTTRPTRDTPHNTRHARTHGTHTRHTQAPP